MVLRRLIFILLFLKLLLFPLLIILLFVVELLPSLVQFYFFVPVRLLRNDRRKSSYGTAAAYDDVWESKAFG